MAPNETLHLYTCYAKICIKEAIQLVLEPLFSEENDVYELSELKQEEALYAERNTDR